MNVRLIANFVNLPIDPEATWQGGILSLNDILSLPVELEELSVLIAMWLALPQGCAKVKAIRPDGGDPFVDFISALPELAEEAGNSHRPSLIECNHRPFAEALGELLAGSGTEVRYEESMPEWEEAMQAALDNLEEGPKPRLPSLQAAGCSETQIAEFAAAANEFYRARLWDILSTDDLIQIEIPHPPQAMQYALMLGSAGLQYGLGTYRNAEDHYAVCAQQVELGDVDTCSLIFETAESAATLDPPLWRALGLPLETGDAFPEVVCNTSSGMRRPTARELEFFTIVLKGLGQTSEVEIDSGRWTKQVEVGGKRKKCVFSIPDLLAPPDRAEWMRRGIMPQSYAPVQAHARIEEIVSSSGPQLTIDELNKTLKAEFSRPIPEVRDLPRNTPAERAEALFAEAVESIGRRRMLLARQALQEVPDHVGALILLAEMTTDDERCVTLYRRAKEAAARQLGDTFEQFVGNFWLYMPTRPYMRACQGLALALTNSGQTNDAIAGYQEMLRLNPHDSQGARYSIVPLLLSVNRDAEAIRILEQFDEETLLWQHIKAVTAFRCKRLTEARRALHAAISANPIVLALVESGPPYPAVRATTPGSPEEAVHCIEELSPAWTETEGYMEWMWEEFELWLREKEQRKREQKKGKARSKSNRKRRK